MVVIKFPQVYSSLGSLELYFEKLPGNDLPCHAIIYNRWFRCAVVAWVGRGKWCLPKFGCQRFGAEMT